MFDTLTLNDLYELHFQIAAESRATHAKIMDGLKPLVSTFSDEWKIAAAKCGELGETLDAVYAEIGRREAETRIDA